MEKFFKLLVLNIEYTLIRKSKDRVYEKWSSDYLGQNIKLRDHLIKKNLWKIRLIYRKQVVNPWHQTPQKLVT